MTVAQMREVDRVMVEEVGITLVQMMENAGRALAELARRALGDVTGKQIVALVGPGGNGGGGLVAARRLAIWGADVSVVLATPQAKMHEAPAHQLAIVVRMGIETVSPDVPIPALERSALLLDSLFGYSLDGPPRGRAATLISAANASGIPILALDVPSGLSADSGEPCDPTVRAQQTLTLALPKMGFAEAGARPYLGELFVADISVPSLVYRRIGLNVGPLFAQSDIVPIALV